MKTIRKGIVAILCAAMILSITGCNGSDNALGNSGQSGDSSTTTTTTVDDDIENPVDVGDITLDIAGGEEIEPVELKYVGNYDITTAGDIKPAVKYLEENYGCTIKTQIVAFSAIEDTILAAIQSDSSPDLIDKQDSTFPHWMSKNMYSDLTDYIDLSQPQWEGLEQYVDRYAWNGKHYYYPWSYDVNPYFMIYNRGLFEDKGIDDPYELYQNDEWTWDSFKQCMVDFVNGDKENYLGFYGYFATSFINSAGATLIGIDDNGKLVNNLKNPTVESTQTFLEELRREGLGNHSFGSYNNVDADPVINGNAAFHIVGGWKITDYAKVQKNDPSLDIFFVPVPRCDDADKYYYSLSTFGYLVPAGSKNVTQACVFINCARLSVTDDSLKETTKESIMKNKKYTDEMYDFLMEFKEVQNFDCILDESFGFPTDTTTIMKELVTNVAFDQTEEQKSWSQMRDEYYDVIQGTIDSYNETLGQ